MPHQRVPANFADFSILQEHLNFRNGRVALNRLMKASISEKMYDWEDPDETKRGVPNIQLVNLYEKWGFGGFGAVFTGNVVIDPNYIYEAGQGIIAKENDSPHMRSWYAKMARAMKANNALAIVQINHPGSSGLTSYTDLHGRKHVINEVVQDPMSFPKEKIQSEIIDRCVYAAKLLSNCGFDGIEISSSHGNLFSQFLSNSNKRTDEYGGSLENQARLHVDIYNAIRNEVPAAGGFLVGIKINSSDFQNTGFRNEDISRLCEIIETTGYDFVEITGGIMEKVVQEAQNNTKSTQESYLLELTQTVFKAFQKTVVYITGGWQTANRMADAVKFGITQGIGLGRPSCSEPNLPKKLLSGVASSVLDEKFPPSDFETSRHAALYQVRVLGSSSIENVISPTDNLPDFTDQEEADNFKKAAADYIKTLAAEGKPDSFADVIHYQPIH